MTQILYTVNWVSIIWVFIIHFPAYSETNYWGILCENSMHFLGWHLSAPTQYLLYVPFLPTFSVSVYQSQCSMHLGFLLFSWWVYWEFITLVAAITMGEEHFCISAISNRKHTSYYLNLKLKICHKQWGECATVHMPFWFLKWWFILFWSVHRKLKQGFSTINTPKGENYTPKEWCDGGCGDIWQHGSRIYINNKSPSAYPLFMRRL